MTGLQVGTATGPSWLRATWESVDVGSIDGIGSSATGSGIIARYFLFLPSLPKDRSQPNEILGCLLLRPLFPGSALLGNFKLLSLQPDAHDFKLLSLQHPAGTHQPSIGA